MGGLELARFVTGLAAEYNNAWLVVERNNHGSGVLALIETVCGYGRIYRQGGQAGWLTTSMSRPAALGRLDAGLGERPVGVRLVAAVVAAERAGRRQRPEHCRWTWLTCAVDLDRAGPDVHRQETSTLAAISSADLLPLRTRQEATATCPDRPQVTAEPSSSTAGTSSSGSSSTSRSNSSRCTLTISVYAATFSALGLRAVSGT